MATNTLCIICEKVIKDRDVKTKAKGQDSVLCEGICQGWMHRTCAGIPKPVFQAVSSSSSPFLCLYCRNSKHEEDISVLENTIKDLKGEIINLKLKISQESQPAAILPPDIPSFADALQTNLPTTMGGSTPIRPSISEDRKYNIVVYGIKECAKGSTRHTRLSKDTDAVSSLISKVDATIPDYSIRDCIRLGKYVEERCRPILVKLTRACQASSILAGRKNLSKSTGVWIKHDMTPSERSIDAILLKKRWELIQSGTDRGNIKIKGNKIFVGNKNYGSVINSAFTLNVSPSSGIEQPTSAAGEAPPSDPLDFNSVDEDSSAGTPPRGNQSN